MSPLWRPSEGGRVRAWTRPAWRPATPTAPASPARGESGPADGSSPHPGLMLMRWDAEANLNRARSPGHRMADDELLNPVFPRDPGGDPHRLTYRVHAGVGELLRRERPRLPSSPTRHLSHDVNTIEQTYEPRQECTTAYRVVASRCRRCHPSGSARQHRWLALIPPTAVYGIGTVGTVRVQRSWIAASGRQATLAVSVARNGRRGTRSRIVVAGSPSGEDRRFRSQSVLGMGVCFPTMAEVADGLNVSVNHVRALIRTGGLSATRKPARSPADRAADVGALDLREVRGEAWLPPRARTVRALGARQRTVRVDDACRPPTRG